MEIVYPTTGPIMYNVKQGAVQMTCTVNREDLSTEQVQQLRERLDVACSLLHLLLVMEGLLPADD